MVAHASSMSALGATAIVATAALTWVIAKKTAKGPKPKNLKLVYFDIAGAAEGIRLTLVCGGIPFEDTRINFPDWPALKPTTPLHQLPVLEVDGVTFPQSMAILRYAGKVSALYPENALVALKCDMVLDTLMDLGQKISTSIHEKDEAKKMAMRKILAEEDIPFFLSKLEEMLLANGGKFFAGDSLTIADLYGAVRLKWIKSGVLDGIPATIVDPYPALCGLIEMVHAVPAIAKYYESKQK